MKKQLFVSLFGAFVSMAASANTNVLCAVNAEEKPNEYSRPLIVKNFQLKDESITEKIYDFEDESVFIFINKQADQKPMISISLANESTKTLSNAAMGFGLDRGSMVGLLSKAHKVSVVCVLSK